MGIAWQLVLNQALAGNREAFGDLCQNYLRPKLAGFIYNILQDAQGVDDMVQDVFEMLIKSYERIEEHDLRSFEAFVFKMAHNICIDKLRRQHHSTRFTLTDASLEDLARTGVPATVIRRLNTLKDREIMGLQNFQRALRTTLADAYCQKIGTRIVKYAEQNRNLAAQVADNQEQPEIPQYARITHQEIEDFVYTAIQSTLSEREWELLHLRDLQGLTYRQIAEKQNMELATVHARHTKILATLQQNETLRARWNDVKQDLTGF